MADLQPASHRPTVPANEAAAEPSAEAAGAAAQSQAASFARLANRITGWTSNLVATAIVVIVCLGVGHTLLDWSRSDEPVASVMPTAGHVDGTAPGSVEFPVAQGLYRQTVTGDRDTVRAVLRQRIEHAVRQLAADGTRLQAAAGRTLSPSEARLLELTANRQATVVEPGRLELHEFIGTFPLWVGLVYVPVPVSADAAAVDTEGTAAAAPTTQRRLTAWGMAVPAGDDRWSLYLQETGAPQQASPQAGLPDLPLPEGCHRTLALSDERGGRLIGFAGETRMETCRRHFDRWASTLQPPRQLAWYGVPGNWRAEVTLPGDKIHTFSPDAGGHRIQVQLATDSRGMVLGLIAIAPASHDTKEQHP